MVFLIDFEEYKDSVKHGDKEGQSPRKPIDLGLVLCNGIRVLDGQECRDDERAHRYNQVAHMIQERISKGTDIIFTKHMNVATPNAVFKVFIYNGGLKNGLIAFFFGLFAQAKEP